MGKKVYLIFGILVLLSLAFVSSGSFGLTSDEEKFTFYTGNLTNWSEMQDVSIDSPADNQFVIWDTGIGKWIKYTFSLSDWWDYDYNDLINEPTALSDFLNDLGFYNSTTLVNVSQLDNNNNYWNDTYATFNKTYADTLYYDIGNSNAYYNSTTLTQSIIQSLGFYNTTEVDDINTSMKNYADSTFITQANEGSLNVNSSNYWDGLNNPSDILGSQINNDLNWINETTLNVSSVNYWSKSGSDVYYSDGNVGIGTSSPNQKLQVVGNVNVSGSIYAGSYESNSPVAFVDKQVGFTRICVQATDGTVLMQTFELNTQTGKYETVYTPGASECYKELLIAQTTSSDYSKDNGNIQLKTTSSQTFKDLWTGETNITVEEFYEDLTSWQTGINYSVGQIVKYDNEAYEVIQAHVSQSSWTPDVAVSLFSARSYVQSGGGIIEEWTQPTGSHDAYNTGDLVKYNGSTYKSLIDGNTWSPDVYPAGWELQ